MISLTADTGPSNYLVQIGRVDVLGSLFENVLVPESVIKELRHANAPEAVRHFGGKLPEWMEVSSLADEDFPYDPRLSRTDLEVITLAERRQSLLLMDEAEVQAAAMQKGVTCIGTLGVLAAAAERKMLSFPESVDRLRKTNIRLPESVISNYLKRYS